MSAATATLNTYELLETIIAALPSKDITQAQRVSKTWHKIIQDSKTIIEARVLKSRPEINAYYSDDDGTVSTLVDPTYLSEVPMSIR